MSMITLSGKSCYSAVKDLSSTQPNKADKNNVPYFRMGHGTKVFIAREDFYREWKQGNVAEMTLEEGERTVEDPETGETKSVPALHFGNFITYNQAKSIAANEGALKGIEAKVAREYSLKDVDITELVG